MTAPADRAALEAALAEARLRRDAAERDVARLEKALGAGAVSPLAPGAFPDLPPVAGVRLATAEAGIRYRGRDDVLLVHLAAGTAVAGVLTTSATRAAPVLWCDARLGAPIPGAQAILVNAGNANAFTGRSGMASVERIAAATGAALDLAPEAVFLASTGVIGERLPDAKITARLQDLAARLAPGGWEGAARAIMTTDTFPKGATAEADLGGIRATLTGIAKGSGMIAPDMATMLAFAFTDAAVAPGALRTALAEANAQSFNSITVDGDTSTSDTLLLAATGAAGNPPIETSEDPRYAAFAAALQALLTDLAHQVVRDGEGATKFVTVTVTGAASAAEARQAARAIANSPLVKTAIAGEDPNWGRIVMAIGKAGVAADRDRLTIRFGDLLVAEQGWVADSYREADGAALMREPEIAISADLGIGAGTATVWTCDLTKRYVEINADYRS